MNYIQNEKDENALYSITQGIITRYSDQTENERKTPLQWMHQ